jgi:hypothetical protein
MHYAYAVDIVKETFCQGEVMNRIQDICFSNSIIADDAVYLWREFHVGLAVVLEIS